MVLRVAPSGTMWYYSHVAITVDTFYLACGVEQGNLLRNNKLPLTDADKLCMLER